MRSHPLSRNPVLIEQIALYILLLGLIVVVGQLFRHSSIPIGLLLTIVGMILSFVPFFPVITLNPELVLNIFLPLLIYQISSFASWREFKKNARPIALLSVGHVFFVTALVAVVIHTLVPELGWPFAFVLGAIVSPPDDVAIVAISEKIKIPNRVLTILEGEGLFNDVAALILFRFALTAALTHEFMALQAVEKFFFIVLGETLYGLLLGYVMGNIRRRIRNSMLHVIASFITPFLAYLPMIAIGSSGILATAIVGFMIGNEFSLCFTSEFRLISRAFWPSLGFVLEGLIFLLVGLDMRSIFDRITTIPTSILMLYAFSTIAVVIIARFIWVFIFVAFLPRFLFPAIRRKDPFPPWQFPFIVSWAGMRGGISLAAALSIPYLPLSNELDSRDLIIFIVFAVILATLVLQGLSLPWVIKQLRVDKIGVNEQKEEELSELTAKLKMARAVLDSLSKYRETNSDPTLLNAIKRRQNEYRRLVKSLKNHMERLGTDAVDLESQSEQTLEGKTEISLLAHILEVERDELFNLWRENKISLAARNKLLSQLDHRAQHHFV